MNSLDRFVVFLATGFGVGYSKKAPGTWGSIVGLPFAYLFAQWNVDHVVRILCLLAICQLGFMITARTERLWGTHDDQRIVIDEIAGQVITLAWFTPTPFTLLLGLGLFRLFDIWKPGPIGWIDEKGPGAWGTFYDDVLAGIAAAVTLAIILATI